RKRMSGDLKIGSYMFLAAHSDQSYGQPGSGTSKLDRSFRVVVHGQKFGDRFWKIGSQFSLTERRAAHNGNAGLRCEFQSGSISAVAGLVLQDKRFGHRQIEWKLNKAEMMVFACDFLGDFDDLGQIDERAIVGGDPESTPGGHAIEANDVLDYGLFQHGEGSEDPAAEFTPPNLSELGFGVVEIKNVNGVQHQILARALNLVGQVDGGHAMHSASNLSGIEDAAFDVFTSEIGARISRNLAIEAEISRFGADQDFIPRY